LIEIDAEIAVIGAGFSGSLMAMLLQRIGLHPVLIDRGTHPRFAIGESSTPVTNLILEDLSRRYDLPRIAPLSNYVRWKQTYPDLVCGLKRGFSYFHHEFDCDFQPRADHANELLVAASIANDDADTHWLRSEFDQFLCMEACALGIPYFDRTTINQVARREDGWELVGNTAESPIRIRADFLIDASGDGGALTKHLQIAAHTDGLKTRSRALFSHFTGVEKWGPIYASRGGIEADHPYPCDDAAVHHVFDGGWMWVLRFDNGVTSAGFSLDPDRFPKETAGTPEVEWDSMLARLPAVAEQFVKAQPIVPWRQTGRIQRRLAQAAGENWCLLPNTAAFHDPLHSTGNTFTMIGIDRLLQIFERSWKRPEFASELQKYADLIQTETEFVDLIISGSFAGFRDFGRMIAMSMFYFSTAIWSEEQRRSGRAIRGSAFLSADQPELRRALQNAYEGISNRNLSTPDLTSAIRDAIAPFNLVGLCDPRKRNLYPYG
jgi:FADH2 O2-dependent halogenase